MSVIQFPPRPLSDLDAIVAELERAAERVRTGEITGVGLVFVTDGGDGVEHHWGFVSPKSVTMFALVTGASRLCANAQPGPKPGRNGGFNE